MLDTPKCPPLDASLLVHLEGVFPNKLPEVVTSKSDLAIKIGEQNVLNHLRKMLKEQKGKGIPDVLK